MFRKMIFAFMLICVIYSSLFAAEPYQGLSGEINSGILFTIGGNKSNSNSEPYFNFLLGYSFSKSSMVGLSLATSMVSNNAPEKKTEANYNINYDNYTLLFSNLTYQYKIEVGKDLFIPVKVFGGGAFASPSPNNKGSFLPDFGMAAGIGYDSYRKGLQLGIEIAFSYILNINAKAAMVYPTIKYVF